jgi:hypothetical protein
MTNTQLDLSMWPPALVFALCVVYVICKVLPDILTIEKALPKGLTVPKVQGLSKKAL